MAGDNGSTPSVETQLREQLQQSNDSLELFTERLAELELAVEDQGWRRLLGGDTVEFSRSTLDEIVYQCRLYYLKNPLIKHAVELQRHYVLGQGVQIQSTDERVNEVVQKFLDDPKNRAELTSHQAMGLKEVDLQLTGNLFMPFFTEKKTGKVRVRSIPMQQITEIVTNPDDAREPWFYKRHWQQGGSERIAYYPDVLHTKTSHMGEEHAGGAHPITAFEDGPIEWDTPILHVKVGGTSDMKFGVPEVYAALDWASAVKTDLENYATVKAALARFAWSMTRKGGQAAIEAAKNKLGTTVGRATGYAEGNPPIAAGSTFIGGEAGMMSPVKTAGAQPSAEEGRALRLMVAAAVGIPETMLMGDADVGNLATSKTLDRPTELKMRDRQTLWADTFRAILAYVITQALEHGDLKANLDKMVSDGPEDKAGKAVMPSKKVPLAEAEDHDDDEPTTAEGEPLKDTIDVSFPPILEHDPETIIGAIVQANGLSMLPERALARLMANAFGLDHVDELINEMFDEETGERKVPLADPMMDPNAQGGAAGGFPPAQPWGKPAAKPGPAKMQRLAASRQLREALSVLRASQEE